MQQIKTWFSVLCFNVLMASIMVANTGDRALTLDPPAPKAGENVKIIYKAKGELASSEKLKALIYTLEGKLPVVSEVELGFNGDAFFGSFQIKETAKSIFIKICDVDESNFDDNEGSGYVYPVYEANSKPIVGSSSSIASIYNAYARVLGIEMDQEVAYKFYMKEFNYNPQEKENPTTYAAYLRTFSAIEPDEAKKLMNVFVDDLIAKASFDSEDEASAGISVARSMRNQVKSDKIMEKAIKQYPGGALAVGQLANEFYSHRSLEKAEPIFKKFQALPESDAKSNNISNMAGRLASFASNSGDMEAFGKYFNYMESNSARSNIMNSLAWSYSGESLEAEASNLEMGLKYGARALKFLDKAKSNKESVYLTQKQWENQIGYSYGMCADTYALLLYKDGQKEEALKYQEIAVEKLGANDVTITERLAIFKEDVEGPKAALSFLQNRIESGSVSPKMSAQFERLYKENKSLDEAFDDYMGLIQIQKSIKAKEELAKELIDLDPITFGLTDMNGESVSLDDYKGKIVILDFWATWCGPCKVSFPGMQAAVDKFADDDDVAFLFLDTWERGENKAGAAKKFMTDNNYTFKVLMDDDNKVVESYGVSGIPTKFVLDGDQRIRFKKVGGDADIDKLVTEITAMIEILRNE